MHRISGSKVEVFGAARPAGKGAVVTIESRVGKGKWKRLALVKAGDQGYFDRKFQVSKANDRHYRFKLGKAKSRVATAHKRR